MMHALCFAFTKSMAPQTWSASYTVSSNFLARRLCWWHLMGTIGNCMEIASSKISLPHATSPAITPESSKSSRLWQTDVDVWVEGSFFKNQTFTFFVNGVGKHLTIRLEFNRFPWAPHIWRGTRSPMAITGDSESQAPSHVESARELEVIRQLSPWLKQVLGRMVALRIEILQCEGGFSDFHTYASHAPRTSAELTDRFRCYVATGSPAIKFHQIKQDRCFPKSIAPPTWKLQLQIIVKKYILPIHYHIIMGSLIMFNPIFNMFHCTKTPIRIQAVSRKKLPIRHPTNLHRFQDLWSANHGAGWRACNKHDLGPGIRMIEGAKWKKTHPKRNGSKLVSTLSRLQVDNNL